MFIIGKHGFSLERAQDESLDVPPPAFITNQGIIISDDIRLRAAAAEGGSSGAPELRSSCQWKDTDTRGMGSDGLRGPELNTNQLVNI